MFTTPLVIATVVAATFGAAIGFLISHAISRPIITRLRAELADVIWKLTHDPLTGLHNRTGLRAVHAAAAAAEPQPLVAVLIDLDLFKEINDDHSHAAGDVVLKATAERIGHLSALYGGHAARLSGDEFAAIMPLGRNRLASIAEQITTVIAEPVEVHTDSGPITIAITASLGVAVTSSTEPLESVALHHADLAMYHAKQQGGNRHVIHQPGMTMPHHQRRNGPRLRDLRHHQRGSAE